MLNKPKLAAVGLLAAVFLAGGLAGWGGHAAAERDDAGMRGRHGPDAMVAYLSHELDLSTAQRDSVRPIFERHPPDPNHQWVFAKNWRNAVQLIDQPNSYASSDDRLQRWAQRESRFIRWL